MYQKVTRKKKTCVKHTIEWPQNLQLQPTLKSKAHSYKLSLETRDDNKRRKQFNWVCLVIQLGVECGGIHKQQMW